MLDVSSAIAMLATGTYPVTRTAAGAYVGGSYVPGATVSLLNFMYPGVTNPATTDINGTFSFSTSGSSSENLYTLPVGTYSLMVSAVDYATEVLNGITINDNGNVITLNIQLNLDYGEV